ncbi:heptaprenyl diphosphate synthase component 1 [Piscibacillus halophilus]|uniref:Heptaprenyl diphosphate synthase (HEPPP synthase) subunit 1 n=1 Tax=Piscibacillus halophilus TaxID=571933 RepID=A0A1H8ZUU9_9BACI|nr:heptaprenyl diphosphate synthase component 1 [Piscibacillus halophilus]SEP68256.1 Heptaprenyl diphosphate synthase (HEPPP synthase) subunit 1 [Piscibacillus halophilus]
MINKQAEQIRKDFIKEYKHPSIKESFYDPVLTVKQVYFFQKLLLESDYKQKNDLFKALIHMQISLDIHDLVDLEFDSIEENRNQTNQLQVLVGDFHSSYFYRLLSEHNLLDELYHFIQSIKSINEIKMSLLHQDEIKIKDFNKLLNQVETVHCGLYYSLLDFCQMNKYKNDVEFELIKELVYHIDSYWLSLLKSREPAIEQAIDAKINYLNEIIITNRR